MMAAMHPDLLLLAAVAWEYEREDIADSLYALAQASTSLTPPMAPGDIQAGLQLMGLDSFRIVGPGLDIPDIIWDAIDAGHVTLAQVDCRPLRNRPFWVALCDGDRQSWHGLCLTSDWLQCSVSSRWEATLTGHYVSVADVLPGWVDGSHV
jgi:hypothetical protein